MHVAMSVCPEGDEEQLEHVTSPSMTSQPHHQSPGFRSRLPSFQEMSEEVEEEEEGEEEEEKDVDHFTDAEVMFHRHPTSVIRIF